jgi:hypothetical protein
MNSFSKAATAAFFSSNKCLSCRQTTFQSADSLAAAAKCCRKTTANVNNIPTQQILPTSRATHLLLAFSHDFLECHEPQHLLLVHPRPVHLLDPPGQILLLLHQLLVLSHPRLMQRPLSRLLLHQSQAEMQGMTRCSQHAGIVTHDRGYRTWRLSSASFCSTFRDSLSSNDMPRNSW